MNGGLGRRFFFARRQSDAHDHPVRRACAARLSPTRPIDISTSLDQCYQGRTTCSIHAGEASMFDLNQLRCFVTVAEELHFGRAAVRLNMTQPPLSRQIQVLEHIIDAALLERTSRSV
ncbi:LysR family transcriptional regulator, partial [Bradyrhizobium sp.]|uniref:LysR family transcriptional regulator n=1 Tax=Bradyrhizobium sp. TaxID=376 RepID=UPI00391CE929